jgi:uncharacterized protein (TIGR00255 family)
MNSMTGYGRAESTSQDYQILVEVSSVNKKSLEVAVSAPKEWSFFEVTATSFLKKKLHRGRVRVSLSVEPLHSSDKVSKVLLGKEFQELIKLLEIFIEKRNQTFILTPETVLHALQLSRQENVSLGISNCEELFIETLQKATASMIEMREMEGREISTDFDTRLQILSHMIEQMEKESANLPEIQRKKLFEKLEKANLDIDPSDERVLKELALYAEKSDVSEEITRLKSHLIQFKETCSSPGSVGRKLEFILQEISRELNTYCAKAARCQGSMVALDARVEVEKIREQVMNIE